MEVTASAARSSAAASATTNSICLILVHACRNARRLRRRASDGHEGSGESTSGSRGPTDVDGRRSWTGEHIERDGGLSGGERLGEWCEGSGEGGGDGEGEPRRDEPGEGIDADDVDRDGSWETELERLGDEITDEAVTLEEAAGGGDGGGVSTTSL